MWGQIGATLRSSVITAAMLAFAAAAGAQQPAEPAAAAPESAKTRLISVSLAEVPAPLPLDPGSVAPATKPKERKTEFLAAPIPLSNPTIGTGLGVVGGLLFPLKKSDTISPPAVAGVGGFYTDSDSFALGAAMRAYIA